MQRPVIPIGWDRKTSNCSNQSSGEERSLEMAGKKILMIVGDSVEDYEVVVPFQAKQASDQTDSTPDRLRAGLHG